MNRYNVVVCAIMELQYQVEAEHKQAAIAKASELFANDKIPHDYYETRVQKLFTKEV